MSLEWALGDVNHLPRLRFDERVGAKLFLLQRDRVQ